MEKVTSRAKPKIVQLEPWLNPAWLGLITSTLLDEVWIMELIFPIISLIMSLGGTFLALSDTM